MKIPRLKALVLICNLLVGSYVAAEDSGDLSKEINELKIKVDSLEKELLNQGKQDSS